ncbi:MAG TPA: ScpA family protein [Burkholderiales bacterium]|nr:ScpA family protein [Burkholderiales bacterium]
MQSSEVGAAESEAALYPGGPVARLYGQPVIEIPADLFIPPDALRVILEAFEGPLDLLLYLIRKHNLDVLDIPMAQLTAQYMGYVEAMRAHQLELAAEYLLMAALLIEIKSRMLLPRPREETEEPEDPRAELVRRLLEYEQMKKAAGRLDELPQLGRDFSLVCVLVEKAISVRLPDVDAEDLRAAWLVLVARARAARHHKVTREQLSVRERMSTILRRLRGHGFLEFAQLFNPARGIADLVVTFLALLELARESLVQVTQQGSFAPIYVRALDGTAA